MQNPVGYGQPSRSPTGSSAQDNQLSSSNLQDMVDRSAADQIAAADDHAQNFGDQVPTIIDYNTLAAVRFKPGVNLTPSLMLLLNKSLKSV